MTDDLWLDVPGAPAGFLLDPDDNRTHDPVDLVDATLWDLPARENALARGDGESDPTWR